MQIIIGEDVTCPCCGRPEVTDTTLPVDQWEWNIRAYRVDDWSNCMRCKIWFDPRGEIEVNDDTDPEIRKKWGMEKNGIYQMHQDGV